MKNRLILLAAIAIVLLNLAACSDDSFTFVVLGDPQIGDTINNNQGEVYQQIVEQIIDMAPKPDFIIGLGDFVQNGSNLTQWNKFIELSKPLNDKGIIIYPAVGNHDYSIDVGLCNCSAEDYSLENYFNMFKHVNNQQYYSFDYRNAHFASLNTNINYSWDSEQYNWLLNDSMKNKNKEWKFVFFHHPFFAIKGYENDKMVVKMSGRIFLLGDILAPIFDKSETQLVFMGHYHHYIRTYPLFKSKENKFHIKDEALSLPELNPEYDFKFGRVYVVSGGAGGHIKTMSQGPRFAKQLKSHNFVKVNVTKNKLYITAYKPNGEVIESFTIKK